MTRVRRDNYRKLTRYIKRIPTCFRHVCSSYLKESLQSETNRGPASNNNQQVMGRDAGASRPPL